MEKRDLHTDSTIVRGLIQCRESIEVISYKIGVSDNDNDEDDDDDDDDVRSAGCRGRGRARSATLSSRG